MRSGEHIVAGKPFPPLPNDFHQRLAAVSEEITHQLGRRPLAELMPADLDQRKHSAKAERGDAADSITS
jgi:hypothetical protein